MGDAKTGDSTPEEPAPERTIKLVKAARTRETGRRYLVVYEDDEDDTGRWVAGSSVTDQHLLLEFDAAHQRRPAAPKTKESSTPAAARASRDLKEIRGIFPMGDTWGFIVRFADSLRDEFLSRQDVRAKFPQQLLRFYERSLELKREELPTDAN
jgi:hypothetical protein